MSYTYILVCKGVLVSSDDFGVARGTVKKDIQPGAEFKTGDFVRDKLGGYSITAIFCCRRLRTIARYAPAVNCRYV